MPVKVDRSNIPLLVVGVGGTGKDIALSIKRKFIERFNNLDPSTLLPPKTAFLVIDADTAGVGPDPHGITGNENCNIVFPHLPVVFEQKAFTAEEQSWVNPNLTPIAIMNGAGGIRQVGRFQLFRNMPQVKSKLLQALQMILGADANNPPEEFSANVLVCGSLSGGTGSGTALDVAYIIRQLIRDQYQAYSTNLKVYGMFLMPECIIQRCKTVLSPVRQTELKANAFAAMKEIDYWMRQDDHGDAINVRYPGWSAHWNCRPFNYLGYLGHTWENGQPINDSYDVAVDKIAELFLLLSTETPQTENGKLAEHNIYSSLSNAGGEMLVHQNDAPYPVSAWAMSLGTSEYSSFEHDIQNYEIKKTLNQVLQVQLFNPKDGETITEHEAQVNSIPAVVGTLGLPETQDLFFQNLTLETDSEEDFRRNTAYPMNDGMFTKAAVEMAGSSYVESVRSFYANQQTEANDYYKGKFDKVWSNFQNEARQAITTISCGPVAFLKFLDEVYIPDVDAALNEARQISAENGDGRMQANEFAAMAEQNYDYLLKIAHPGLNPQLLIAAAQWNNYASTYAQNIANLSASEWNWRCMAGKVIALNDYMARLTNYRQNLSLIIDTVKREENKLETDASRDIDEHSLLTFDQLRKYLEGVNLPDAGIARARDQVLRQIADLSFELPRVDLAESFEEQAKLFQVFTDKVRVFVQACFSDQSLTNMDRVLDAAVADSNETAQNYMANTIAPRLASAAQPMLHLETAARAMAAEFYEYHHIAVPKDAPNMIAGLTQYQSGKGDSRSDYSRSNIVDRMLTLNLKVCIPMYMMADTVKLMDCYESQLNRTTSATSQGLHLVGTNQSNSLSDTTNTIDKSWRRLPCPIPPTEMSDVMSPMQKENMEYLEKRFQEALKNGIITFAGEGGVAPYQPGNPEGTYVQEVFEIHDFSLDGVTGTVNSMMLEDIREAIDRVKNDNNLRPQSRLEKLKKMRSGAPVRSIHYGKYMFNYANALQKTPIQPLLTDDRTVRTACAEKYIETRMKLCSYMLGLYPRCLDLVEKEFKIFDYLHEAEEYLEKELDKENKRSAQLDDYCMLFVADVIVRKLDWLGLNYKGEFMRLFQNNADVMPMEQLKDYYELGFIRQLEANLPNIPEGLIDQIEEEKHNYPADALTIEERSMTAEIKPMLDKKVERWEQALTSIKDNMTLKRLEKEEMRNFYERLLKKAKEIKTALEMV